MYPFIIHCIDPFINTRANRVIDHGRDGNNLWGDGYGRGILVVTIGNSE